MIRAGKTTFNSEALKEWTKKQFIDAYKGKVNADLNQVWEQIQKVNDTTEDNKRFGKKIKKGGKTRRDNEAPIQSSGISEADN